MKRRFPVFSLLLILFLTLGAFQMGPVRAENQNNYILQIQGIAWNHSILNILLITPTNESGWNSVYLNSTLRAIGQWNEAVGFFSSNNVGYEYLSSLKLQATVSNQTLPGYDIYVNWSDYPPPSASSELGLTSPLYQQNVIINCSIILSIHASHGQPLTDGDMQNIALHELGHSLGLGHSNFTGDVMYPVYTLLSPGRKLSTLDLYGVATTFEWLTNPSEFSPVSQWLSNNPVTLPSIISYQYLPVNSQNAVPPNIAANPVVETLVLVFEIIIHPEILVVVIAYVAVLTAIAFYPKKRKTKTETKPSKKPPTTTPPS